MKGKNALLAYRWLVRSSFFTITFLSTLAIPETRAATLILEDFSSSASNFTEVAGGTWSISGGRYVLSSPASSSTAGVLGNISVHDITIFDDFELSVTMRITGTGSAWDDGAIIFGYQDSSNYYYVSLNESNAGDTKGILKVVNGTPTELADISSSISSDTDYTVEIERNGSSIVVFLNSNQVASTSDSTFTSGKVGIGSYNDGAAFDDLTVITGGIAVNAVTSSGDDGTNIDDNTLDGNLGTRWSADGNGAWIKFELDNIYTVSELDIAFYNGNQRVTYFDIETSTDNTNWTTVYSGQSSGSTLNLETFTLTTSNAKYVRYVGYGNSSNTWNSVTEVELSGDLPIISTVTSSGDDGTNVDDNTLDGNLGTRWSADGNGEWIKYELSGTYSISSIDVAFYNGDQRVTYFDIETSTNNTSWTTVYSGQSSGNTLNLETFTLTTSNAEYVRYVGYGNSSNTWNSVTEVEINITSGGGSDTQAPSVPTGLSYSNVTTSSVDLSWNASSDNVGVSGYKIYTGGSNPINVSGTSTTISGLSPSTSYSFTVSAYDAASNESSQSSAVNVTTGGSVPTTTSLSQFGITWNFTNAVKYGQFANGDYWVVDNGNGVQIASITPGWDGTRNGTMINPIPNQDQGFDTRTPSFNYSASINIADNLPYTVSQPSSVVSCISFSGGTSPYYIDTVAILTVLSSVPPSGAFRPPYAGTDKSIVATTADLDYSKLQSLSSSSITNIPSLSSVEAKFERPWIDLRNGATAAHLHPLSNQNWYGREQAHATGEAGLMLNLDFTNAQKETLLIRYVQLGIDIYGAAENGHVWAADGGHKQGRKLPLLLAGWVLQDQDMLDWADAGQNHIFQEDLQTGYVSQTLVNATNSGSWNPHPYSPNPTPYNSSDIGDVEWAIRMYQNPYMSDKDWNAIYRDVNGGPGTATCLTAYVMGLESEWNWPAFFEYYIDRWWPNENAYASSGANSMSLFAKSFWQVHGP